MIVFLLGILSVMLLLFLTLSQRKTGQVQLLSMLDQSQTARYYLEARCRDVIAQFRKAANLPGSPLHGFLRDPKSVGRVVPLSALGYSPSTLVSALGERLGVDEADDPKITLVGWGALKYPSMMEVPPETADRGGGLSLECSALIRGRKYSMNMGFGVKMVGYLVPLLREFILFCDQLHLEQSSPFGEPDKLNILFTRRSDTPTDSDNPSNVNIPGEYREFSGKPWILYPTESFEGDPTRNGRVYFGGDSRNLFLNMAGEMLFRGFDSSTGRQDEPLSDLWTISPKGFPMNSAGAVFNAFPWYQRPGDLGHVTLRSLQFVHPANRDLTRICLVGFGAEIDDRTEGNFLNSGVSLDSFMKEDPAFQALSQDRKKLALSSAFRLLGPNLESNGLAAPIVPVRQVFGNVFARFFQIAFWESSSGCRPLEYVPAALGNSSFAPPQISIMGVNSNWEPKDPSEKYSDYMSQVVSGGDPGSPKSNRFPVNLEAGVPMTYSSSQFKPVDGVTIKGPFDRFGPEWFGGDSPDLSPICLDRVCRFFPDQEAFKKYSGLDRTPPRFWVEGVVYVKGNLELPEITTSDIRGGVVIVEGSVTLNDITRGYSNLDTAAGMAALLKGMKSLPQNQFLTFVSFRGEPITLAGDHHVGIQVVSFKPGLKKPISQITWKIGKDVRFIGGVAVSTPNMAERVKEFKKNPFFMYVPCMSQPLQDKLVHVSTKPESYEFFAD